MVSKVDLRIELGIAKMAKSLKSVVTEKTGFTRSGLEKTGRWKVERYP